MLEIPRITPVREKTMQIPQELIDPGSMARYFPQEAGTRVVYLDERYDYPEQTGYGPESERQRQAIIWRQVMGDGATQFLDQRVEREAGLAKAALVRDRVFNEIGTRYSAEFFERVFSELFGQTMNVVVISTGVRPFDGYNYHDIGYLNK